MATSISRRTLLAVGAGTLAGVALPGSAAHVNARATTNVGFTLNAQVLDGGEQVTSITLRTARFGPIDPTSLTTGTFRVHAKATSPVPAAGDAVQGEYDTDRMVSAVRLDRLGNIVLELSHAEGRTGGNTLGYLTGRGRSVMLDLVYTLTQRAPITLLDRRSVMIGKFAQEPRLSDPEVDAFSFHVSGSGMKYRLYSPIGSRPAPEGRLPLIVWLHGAGEGASLPDRYYDNETTLRANRGALGFATPQAQRIFNGAYVLVPQSTSYWMEDGPRFAPLIREIISDVTRENLIDPHRIYIAGCSNGGYMSMKMTVVYPTLFAASVPICGIVTGFPPGGASLLPDGELAQIDTPSWLVASRDDPIVNSQTNTVHAHGVIPRSLMTLYDHVVRNGHQFPGHCSWVHVARNDPSTNGTHIWQWMAARRRHREGES
ncbi:prolyl oligopeptidase family serine peptidase [Streptomyces sp. cmx-4-7]|uniref:prolyl oligopeptidase family serine peptidase n=1 Tax=Streptomyces sp. cmx-4-7 TaxID=2790939 RepID=UPI00397EB59A